MKTKASWLLPSVLVLASACGQSALDPGDRNADVLRADSDALVTVDDTGSHGADHQGSFSKSESEFLLTPAAASMVGGVRVVWQYDQYYQAALRHVANEHGQEVASSQHHATEHLEHDARAAWVAGDRYSSRKMIAQAYSGMIEVILDALGAAPIDELLNLAGAHYERGSARLSAAGVGDSDRLVGAVVHARLRAVMVRDTIAAAKAALTNGNRAGALQLAVRARLLAERMDYSFDRFLNHEPGPRRPGKDPALPKDH